jgi:hypothetical protein
LDKGRLREFSSIYREGYEYIWYMKLNLSKVEFEQYIQAFAFSCETEYFCPFANHVTPQGKSV